MKPADIKKAAAAISNTRKITAILSAGILASVALTGCGGSGSSNLMSDSTVSRTHSAAGRPAVSETDSATENSTAPAADSMAEGSGQKPFEDLDASKIASATVRLIPPDKTVQITDIEELADHLNEVVIYQKDNSYNDYEGQACIFTLTMSDGTQTKIMEYNPFLVIDDIGYITEYEPCESLNNYANRLLDDENASIIVEDPPIVDVLVDETLNQTLLGTYSWQRKNDDGTYSTTEADSLHPLDCKEFMIQFETLETTATLCFLNEPDAILDVRCWSDEHWSDPSADSENVSVNGNEIELKPGGYIYEVTAQWDSEKSGYGGIARYSFYAIVSE